MSGVKAWHFLAYDRILGYGDGRRVGCGEKLPMMTRCNNYCTWACMAPLGERPKTPCVRELPSWEPRPLGLCSSGMHASLEIDDAMMYASGTAILTEVLLEGAIVRGSDKIAGEYRTVLWDTGLTKYDILTEVAGVYGQYLRDSAFLDGQEDEGFSRSSVVTYFVESMRVKEKVNGK